MPTALPPILSTVGRAALVFLVFHILWTVAAWLQIRRGERHIRSMERAGDEDTAPLPNGFVEQLLGFAHLFSPMLVSIILAVAVPAFERQYGLRLFPYGTEGFLLLGSLFLIPNLILTLLYLLVSVGQMRRQLGGGVKARDSRNLAIMSFGAAILITGVSLVCLAWYSGVIASLLHVLGLLLLLLVVVMTLTAVTGNLHVQKASKKKPDELEPSPLRSELERLIIATGNKPGVITPLANKRKPGARAQTNMEFSRRMALWFRTVRPDRLAVPLGLTAKISSDALTAGLASRFNDLTIMAGRDHPGGPVRRLFQRFSRFFRFGILAVFVVLLAILQVPGGLSPAAIRVVTVILAGIAIAQIVLVGLIIVRRMRLRTPESLQGTLEAWQAAEPEAERTMRDYLLRVTEFNLAMNPHLSAKVFLRFTFGSPGIAAYLKSLPEEEARSLRAELTEMIERGAGAEAAAGAAGLSER